MRFYACMCTELELNRRATQSEPLKFMSRARALHMLFMQVPASQLPFLANRNAKLFWPVICIKIGGDVAHVYGKFKYSSCFRSWKKMFLSMEGLYMSSQGRQKL